MNWFRNFVLTLVWLALSTLAAAAPYRGVVSYGALPLPGATITATQGTKTLTAVSDQDGAFQFDDLADGQWTIQISMQLFATLKTDVTIAPNMPGAKFEMKLLPEGQILSESQTATQPVETAEQRKARLDYERRAAMGVIELADAAIATSGDYRRWADVGGARISHTMDPRTGAPLAGGMASVTVVAKTCADADAYATALMVLGAQAGPDYARQRGLDVLFIVRDGEALRTIGTGCFAGEASSS